MDKFKSIALVLEPKAGGTLDLDAFVCDEMLDLHEEGDDLHIDLEAMGWEHGGLNVLLKGIPQKGGVPLYFRGATLFTNFDDAKNYYLADPEIDQLASEEEGYDYKHVPFGMVLPHWSISTAPISAVPARSFELVGATVILFWQEQI